MIAALSTGATIILGLERTPANQHVEDQREGSPPVSITPNTKRQGPAGQEREVHAPEKAARQDCWQGYCPPELGMLIIPKFYCGH